MGHDEIRDYLERIEGKIDEITLEVNGDKDHPGFRARLATLEMYVNVIKWTVGAVVVAALGWVFGLFGKGK